MSAARGHAGAALIETCQRIEAVSLDGCSLGCSSTRTGDEAFRYLVRLAAGLESIVLGEKEIVGQVREAARIASPELSSLLGRSIAAARAFRRRHGFHSDSGNLFDLATENAGESPSTVIVVGSGPTARRIVHRVGSERGVAVMVASRRRPEWANGTETRWHTLEQLGGVTQADMAFICLGGDAPTLLPSQVPARVVVDVSTPRRTRIGAPGVLTLRDLREHAVATETATRETLLADLERESDRALAAWAEDSRSPVGRFRHAAELIRQEEVERIARRHPDLPKEALEVITRTLMNRLLHAPSMRMRSLDPELATIVADIFEHEPGRTTRWSD